MKINFLALFPVALGQYPSPKEVLEAYWADERVDFDEATKSTQWHDCGQKPPTPADARDVVCYGARCYIVCHKGKNVKKTNVNVDILARNRNFEVILLDKNRNFGEKSKLWSKIQTLVKNPNFGQKLKF